MEANAGKSFQMQTLFNIFPCISLHCKLVPVQYWEYEYGLLAKWGKLNLMTTQAHYGDTAKIMLTSGQLGISNMPGTYIKIKILATSMLSFESQKRIIKGKEMKVRVSSRL